jgi:hypothetical protein
MTRRNPRAMAAATATASALPLKDCGAMTTRYGMRRSVNGLTERGREQK